jgi:uncharacterized protein YaeQ
VALTATLYRFTIEVSDISRGVYETLELRVAMHPSESLPYLLSRVLAFALNTQEGLEFSSGGLSDTETPAITLPGPHGTPSLVIEIGSPTARRLHKAMKGCESLKVYTYKNLDSLLTEIRSEKVHHADRIEFYALEQRVLDDLGQSLKRDNRWSLLHDEGQLTVHVGDVSFTTEVVRRSV